jgi:hypothetical protein
MLSAADLAKRALVMFLKSLPASDLLVERSAATSIGSQKQRIGVPEVPWIFGLPFSASCVWLWIFSLLFEECSHL